MFVEPTFVRMRPMNVRFWVASMSILLAAPAMGDLAAEGEIRRLDAEEAGAMLCHDLPALERNWDEGIVVNAPDDVVKSKSEVRVAVREGRIRYELFERAGAGRCWHATRTR